jgi:CheY-like chemotaxis protein
MLVRKLENDVRTASDGRQAIEVAEQFCPQVVLMDIGMPHMNGMDAARHIRQQPWGEGMKLVALTGLGPRGGPDANAGGGL